MLWYLSSEGIPKVQVQEYLREGSLQRAAADRRESRWRETAKGGVQFQEESERLAFCLRSGFAWLDRHVAVFGSCVAPDCFRTDRYAARRRQIAKDSRTQRQRQFGVFSLTFEERTERYNYDHEESS
jgi:hypothetical protein